MNTLKYVVKESPVTKKNSQRIAYNQVTKRIFIAPSKQYKEYEKKAMWYLKPVPFAPIDKPVNIKCLFYMPTRRICDLTNLLEAVDDILVKAHIIQDDNYHIVAGHDGSRVYVDKNNPRTEIYITEMEE